MTTDRVHHSQTCTTRNAFTKVLDAKGNDTKGNSNLQEGTESTRNDKIWSK